MPSTGETSTQPGIYRSDCCDYEINHGKGERFPFCRGCMKMAEWTRVGPTD